jgi:oligopeptide/dipeptide ABC transporter ATP-binding protein
VERPVTAGRVVARERGSDRDPAPLLEVRDLRVRFTRAGRAVHAVNGLSYRLAPGRMLAIIGESGSGKSVSSRALMGLLPLTAHVSGSARFDGTELVGLPEREMRRHRGADIAMVFQDPARSLNPTMRIGTQITEAVRAHGRVDRDTARARAVELLQLVRLPAPERRVHEYPHQLSGGMRQRVMIAIALAGRPRLGTAVILISHDLALAASYADDVVVMYGGRAVERAPAATLFGSVRMPYTRALLGSIPLLERPAHTALPVVPGQPPDPAALPAGCPFRPRCGSATDRCATAPELLEHEPEHWWACWHPEPPGPAETTSGSAPLRGRGT